REELEGGSGQLPGPLGGRRLIPKLLSLTPQFARRCRITSLRCSLTAHLVQLLLGSLGTLKGAGGCPPSLPQGTAPFADRVEDVQHVLEVVGSTLGATSGTLQLQPLAQAAAIVPDDG